MSDTRRIQEIVGTWQTVRTHGRTFTAADLREFAERQNGITRMLIAALDVKDPEWWSALAELATNAGTLTDKKAKLIVNGKELKK